MLHVRHGEVLHVVQVRQSHGAAPGELPVPGSSPAARAARRRVKLCHGHAEVIERCLTVSGWIFKVQVEGDAHCWPKACGRLASLHSPCKPVAVRTSTQGRICPSVHSPASLCVFQGFWETPWGCQVAAWQNRTSPSSGHCGTLGAGDGQEGMQLSTGCRDTLWHGQGEMGEGSRGLGELTPGGNSPACRCLIGLLHQAALH